MVSVNINESMDYCYDAPFYPPQSYPELDRWQCEELNEKNSVYQHVRKCIENYGFDSEHVGTEKWNPLGDIIKPGDIVVLKPNLVMHHNQGKEDICAVVTHGSMIRPVLDYVFIALKGEGKVIVGDAPQANANFDTIVKKNGLRKLIDWYREKGMPIELIDFRKNYYPDDYTKGIKKMLPGDPNGYICVDLQERSFLDNLDHLDKLYGSEYDRNFIVRQHNNGHKYLLSGSVMQADVIINMPKLKTHRKAGVTINAKNLVGANGDKNYLAHYRVGCHNGGDEYPADVPLLSKLCYQWDRIARDHILICDTMASRVVFNVLNKPFALLEKIYYASTGKKLVDGFGDWHGNDTVWRMCLDLNQIVLFCDKNGVYRKTPQRKYISFVDGIIAGEGDGPMFPTAKHCGFVACGVDSPFMTDYVCIHMMGFSPDKLKINHEAEKSDAFAFNPDEIKVTCEHNGNYVHWKEINLHFLPQHNWIGFVER